MFNYLFDEMNKFYALATFVITKYSHGKILFRVADETLILWYRYDIEKGDGDCYS